jgi:hypothetical protein
MIQRAIKVVVKNMKQGRLRAKVYKEQKEQYYYYNKHYLGEFFHLHFLSAVSCFKIGNRQLNISYYFSVLNFFFQFLTFIVDSDIFNI